MACNSSGDESECVFNSTTDINAMSAYGFNTIQPRPCVELSERRSPTLTQVDSEDEIERTSVREKFLPTNDLTDRRSPTLQESLDAQLAFDLQNKIDMKAKQLGTMFREPVPEPLSDTENSETGWIDRIFEECEYSDDKFLPTNDLTDRRSPTLQESRDAQLAFDLQTQLDMKDKESRTMFREPFRVPEPLSDTVNSETGWVDRIFEECEYSDDKSFAEKLQLEEDAESARHLQENDVVHGGRDNRRHPMHPCLRAQVIGGLGQIPASLERRRGVNNPEFRFSTAPSHQQRSHGNNNSINGASLHTEHNLPLQNRQGIQNHMANPRISREVPLHHTFNLQQLFNGLIEVDGVNGGVNGGVNNEMTYEQILDLEDQLGEAKNRGMNIRDIQNIPQYPYEPASESKGDDSLCCICSESLERGENVRQLPCNHKYHQPCIDKWLQRKAECPVCRKQFVTGSNAKPSV